VDRVQILRRGIAVWRKRGPKLGDVFEIRTPAGLAYVQYTHDDSSLGQLVRVLPGLYAKRPDLKRLISEKELYFIFYPVEYALRDGQVEVVSQDAVPPWAIPFPTMRKPGGHDRNGRTTNWLIGDGSKQSTMEEIKRLVHVRDEDLTAEQRRLSIGSTLWPHPILVKELARGWVPERAEEFRLLDIAAAEARKRSGVMRDKQEEPKVLDHYLYFPEKANAERAAVKMREKGWTVEVKMGADGENWLALAKQPAPIEEDIGGIRDELEELADRLGGEYDGWGAAV
jgi:regulator of ribonuclease activity B